jgi:hypothetical protein
MNTTPTHRIIDGTFKGKECRIIGGFNNKRKSVHIENYVKNPQLVREELLRPLTRETSEQPLNIAQIEREAVNSVLIDIANEIQRRSLDLAGFTSEMSVQKVKTHTEVIQLLTSFMR